MPKTWAQVGVVKFSPLWRSKSKIFYDCHWWSYHKERRVLRCARAVEGGGVWPGASDMGQRGSHWCGGGVGVGKMRLEWGLWGLVDLKRGE